MANAVQCIFTRIEDKPGNAPAMNGQFMSATANCGLSWMAKRECLSEVVEYWSG
jgi:hypothetical protein